VTHALFENAWLFLPESWWGESDVVWRSCLKARVPEATPFLPKPRIGSELLHESLGRGVRDLRWIIVGESLDPELEDPEWAFHSL
jgi:hypothetical protein